jgi:HPt (histidine-containing phosphotransfer) domain-containing protein
MTGSIEKDALRSLATQMGGDEPLGRIIAMYTGKLPGELDQLRSAVDAGDLETVQSSAHRLKSSSGQLGARRLSVMLAGLEHAGRDGDATGASRILAEVEAEASQATQELKNLSP